MNTVNTNYLANFMLNQKSNDFDTKPSFQKNSTSIMNSYSLTSAKQGTLEGFEKIALTEITKKETEKAEIEARFNARADYNSKINAIDHLVEYRAKLGSALKNCKDEKEEKKIQDRIDYCNREIQRLHKEANALAEKYNLTTSLGKYYVSSPSFKEEGDVEHEFTPEELGITADDEY